MSFFPPTYAVLPTDDVDATEDAQATEGTPVETEPVETVDIGDLTLQDAPSYSSGELFKDKNVMNILLVGSDERTEGFVKSSRGDVNTANCIDNFLNGSKVYPNITV